MKAYAWANPPRPSDAWAVHQELLDSGLQPDSGQYGWLINRLAKSNACGDIVNDMRRVKLQPSLYKCITAAIAHLKEGMPQMTIKWIRTATEDHEIWKQAQSALHVQKKVIDSDCPCMSCQCRDCLSKIRYQKVSVSPNELREMVDGIRNVQQLARQESGPDVSLSYHKHLLRLYCAMGPEDIDSALNEMKTIQYLVSNSTVACSLDEEDYVSLLKVCFDAERLDDAKDIIFGDLRSYLEDFYPSPDREGALRAQSNLLVSALIRSGRGDRVDVVMYEIKAADAKPDGTTYDSMIDAFREIRDLSSVIHYLRVKANCLHTPVLGNDTEMEWDDLVAGCVSNGMAPETVYPLLTLMKDIGVIAPSKEFAALSTDSDGTETFVQPESGDPNDVVIMRLRISDGQGLFDKGAKGAFKRLDEAFKKQVELISDPVPGQRVGPLIRHVVGVDCVLSLVTRKAVAEDLAEIAKEFALPEDAHKNHRRPLARLLYIFYELYCRMGESEVPDPTRAVGQRRKMVSISNAVLEGTVHRTTVYNKPHKTGPRDWAWVTLPVEPKLWSELKFGSTDAAM